MHVVVLGGGYAGLSVTRELERRLPSDVRLTLVNETPDHVLKHELHRVIRRPELANAIRLSLPAVTDRARIHVATAEELDRDERTVECSTGPIEYDYCVSCLGTVTDFHGLSSVRSRAIPVASSDDALAIRTAVRESIDSTSEPVDIVVGGAGLSGIQVAGELAALARELQAANRTTVTLLEQADSVAPELPARFASAIRERLEAADIRVETETTVVGAVDGAIETDDGRSLPFDHLVWTGGIRGPDAQRGTRPSVGSELRLDRATFGCGDAVRIADANGDPVPASAQSARQAARTAATNVDRLVRRDLSATPPSDADLAAFEWSPSGWAVSVGDDAVAIVGSKVVTGRAARLAKAAASARHLASIGAPRRAVGLARAELATGSVDGR